MDELFDNFYALILVKMVTIRNKDGKINNEQLKLISEEIKKENIEFKNINVSDHFIKNFVKKYNLKFKMLHGDVKSADYEGIKDFKIRLKQLIDNFEYKINNVYNLDETSLFIKRYGKRSYTTDKNDK